MNAITPTNTVCQIALNKLVPSKANVRRTGRGQRIEELASSIAAHGLLQNLAVKPTGKDRFEVVAGERRLTALKLLVKRKQLAKDAPIPCKLLAEENVTEISLAENVGHEPMHPADQYEAFAELHGQDMPVEDIAARFGVSPTVVMQRLKLGAVSPNLMRLYRDGEMNLEQLSAFVITDDHERQERTWEGLGYNRSRTAILRALSEGQVSSDDERVTFVGLETYLAAGGTIVRDLFDEHGGGYLENAELLNRLVNDKLCVEAEKVRAEGWHWVQVEVEFDHGMTDGMRRVYPAQRTFTEAEEAELERLTERYDAICTADEGEDDEAIGQELSELDAQMDAIRGADIYADEDRAFAGAIVSVDGAGSVKVLRGLVRREDDRRYAGAVVERVDGGEAKPKSPDGLPASLIAELTAHRTAALANELAQQPTLAMVAVTHVLAAEVFFDRVVGVSCCEISGRRASLRGFAKDIHESRAMTAIEARNEEWQNRMPEDTDDLWTFVTGLSDGERLDLLAHCVSLTVDAVVAPKSTGANLPPADILAAALGLDMATYWQPTAENYFGKLTKPAMLKTVREAVSPEAAQTMDALKKPEMAKRAEKLIGGKNWLPTVLQ